MRLDQRLAGCGTLMRHMPNPVDAYLAKQPPATRAVLRQVRATIKRALPKAEELLSYGIPAYRQHQRIVLPASR